MTFSRQMISGLSLGLALAAGSLSAAAADLSYGAGMSRVAVPAAVPVPAPVPVPDIMSGYYLRLDAAYAFNDTSKYTANDPGIDSLRSDSGLSNFGRLGIGAGFYFSRWFRSDITLDARDEVHSTGTGTLYSTTPNTLGGTAHLRTTYADSFRTRNYTGLVNGYFDLPVHSTITPYIGAGIGWVLHTSPGRAFQVTQTCTDAIGCPFTTSFAAANGSRQNDIQLAAAFMAGFTYQLASWGKIDIGYRLLHLDGTTFTTKLTNGSWPSSVAIPDQINHEIRVGYRMDIN